MAKTTRTSTKTRFGYRRVNKMFGKGTKMKWGRKEATVEKTSSKVPKKISSEQIVAGMKTDAGKLKGIKAIERGKSTRSALLSGGATLSQEIAGRNIQAIGSTSTQKSNSGDLSQLVSGGIQTTGTSRDEDDDNPEVN